MPSRESFPHGGRSGSTPPASPEVRLQNTLEGSLEQRTWAGICDRLDQLHAIGAMPTSSPDEARCLIAVDFRQYRNRNIDKAHAAEKDRRYRDVAELLLLSGNAWPLVQTDWSIDRIETAEKALGIQSFQQLERVMAERYAHPGDVRTRTQACVHLHKGPGNGQLMYYLRKGKRSNRDPAPGSEEWKTDLLFRGTAFERRRSEVWEEVGVGDRLYFSLESVLQRFVRADRAGDAGVKMTVHVLGLLLAEKLGHHWFDRSKDLGSALRRDQQQRPIDLNDLFAFLAHPEWMSAGRITDAEKFRSSDESSVQKQTDLCVADGAMIAKGAYRESREFEHDTQASLDILASQNLLLRWIRLPQWEIDRQLKKKRGDILVHITHRIHDLQAACNAQRPTWKTAVQPQNLIISDPMRSSIGALQSIQADADAWKPWKLPSSVESLCTLLAGDSVDMSTVRKLLQQSKLDIAQMRKIVIKSGNEPDAAEGSDIPDSLACLREVFDDRFMAALEQHDRYKEPDYRLHSPPLDLNREGPEMYLHNLLIGRFTDRDTHQMIPESSCLLISAVRSDSHESHEDFAADIEWNLRTLKPGGALLTDGLRQAQTRIYRFAQIASAMRNAMKTDSLMKLQADVILDKKSHDPVSVLIQRRHPTAKHGFLTEPDKDAMFSNAVYRRSLEDVMPLRPNIQIMNSIRGQLIELAGGNDKIFYRLHEQVQHNVHTVLRRMAAAKLVERNHLMDFRIAGEVRAKILAVRDADDASKRPFYGRHLDREPPVQAGSLGGDFYDIRTRLISFFQAARELPIRTKYDDALYSTLVDRLVDAWPQEHASSTAWLDRNPVSGIGRTTDEQRKEIKELLLDLASNTRYDPDPLLNNHDIEQAVEIVGDALRALVVPRLSCAEEKPIVRGFHELPPSSIHAIPRRGEPSAGFNSQFSRPFHELPANEKFALPGLKESLRQKRAELVALLNKLRRSCGKPPVTLVRFADCPTNVFLGRELEGLLGRDYAQLLELISIDFNKARPEEAIRHMSVVQAKLQAALQHPGLLIVGGSYYDAHDEYGSFFKKHIGRQILAQAADPRSAVRVHGICFGYQTMADEIGSRVKAPTLVTEAGALEFCPAPVQVTQPHPLFDNCPHTMTLAQTHSGHLGGLTHGIGDVISPIAVSGLTGHTVAYTAFDGRVTGMQAHPEVRIRLHEDRVALMKDLAAIDLVLEKAFGVKARNIDVMWQEAAHHVEAEAGPHILVNALLHHTRGILSTKPRSARAQGPQSKRTAR